MVTYRFYRKEAITMTAKKLAVAKRKFRSNLEAFVQEVLNTTFSKENSLAEFQLKNCERREQLKKRAGDLGLTFGLEAMRAQKRLVQEREELKRQEGMDAL